MSSFHIGPHRIAKDAPTYFIADVGANHDGDLERAKDLIYKCAEAGARSVDDHSIEDHVATLDHLAVAAPDGHSRITCPGEADRGYPPFAVDLVEGKFVVTASDACSMRAATSAGCET